MYTKNILIIIYDILKSNIIINNKYINDDNKIKKSINIRLIRL